MIDNLLKHEQIVLSIVQEYLNKNRCFTIDDIVPYINFRIKKFSENIDQAGIKEILKSLVKKKQILEGSKLVKEDVLNNDNRRKIFNFICKNPGVYFNRIAEELDLSNYILAWHIKMLLKFNYIRSKVIEKHEVFFNADFQVDSEKEQVLFFISKQKVRKIIDYLNYNPEGCSKTRISKELGMHSTTIDRYMNKLEKYGILQKKRLSNKTLYFINDNCYRDFLNN